jgi:hypothetical protein
MYQLHIVNLPHLCLLRATTPRRPPLGEPSLDHLLGTEIVRTDNVKAAEGGIAHAHTVTDTATPQTSALKVSISATRAGAQQDLPQVSKASMLDLDKKPARSTFPTPGLGVQEVGGMHYGAELLDMPAHPRVAAAHQHT